MYLNVSVISFFPALSGLGVPGYYGQVLPFDTVSMVIDAAITIKTKPMML
jgi:hypothetical protein